MTNLFFLPVQRRFVLHFQGSISGIFSVGTVADSKNIKAWIERESVSSIRTENEYEGIDAMSKSKKAVVIGGGFIGLEMAECLVERSLDVTLLEKLDQVMAPLDPEMARVVKRYMKKHGITVKTGDGVAGFRKG